MGEENVWSFRNSMASFSPTWAFILSTISLVFRRSSASIRSTFWATVTDASSVNGLLPLRFWYVDVEGLTDGSAPPPFSGTLVRMCLGKFNIFCLLSQKWQLFDWVVAIILPAIFYFIFTHAAIKLVKSMLCKMKMSWNILKNFGIVSLMNHFDKKWEIQL